MDDDSPPADTLDDSESPDFPTPDILEDSQSPDIPEISQSPDNVEESPEVGSSAGIAYSTKCCCERCECVECCVEALKKQETFPQGDLHSCDCKSPPPPPPSICPKQTRLPDCTCPPGRACTICKEGLAMMRPKPQVSFSKRCIIHKEMNCFCVTPKVQQLSAHPPGCDCLDCLCKPFRDHFSKGDTSKHSLDCTCLRCLTEPGKGKLRESENTITETLKACREQTCRKLFDRSVANPENCTCVVCRTCSCLVQDDSLEGPRKICPCIECNCLAGSPPIIIKHCETVIENDEEQPDCCRRVCGKKEDASVCYRPKPICGRKVCEKKDDAPECCKPKPDCGRKVCEKKEEPPKPDCCKKICEKKEFATVCSRQEAIQELQTLLKNIQQSCCTAEKQASDSCCPEETPLSYSSCKDLCELELALALLRKSKQKDCWVLPCNTAEKQPSHRCCIEETPLDSSSCKDLGELELAIALLRKSKQRDCGLVSEISNLKDRILDKMLNEIIKKVNTIPRKSPVCPRHPAKQSSTFTWSCPATDQTEKTENKAAICCCMGATHQLNESSCVCAIDSLQNQENNCQIKNDCCQSPPPPRPCCLKTNKQQNSNLCTSKSTNKKPPCFPQPVNLFIKDACCQCYPEPSTAADILPSCLMPKHDPPCPPQAILEIKNCTCNRQPNPCVPNPRAPNPCPPDPCLPNPCAPNPCALNEDFTQCLVSALFAELGKCLNLPSRPKLNIPPCVLSNIAQEQSKVVASSHKEPSIEQPDQLPEPEEAAIEESASAKVADDKPINEIENQQEEEIPYSKPPCIGNECLIAALLQHLSKQIDLPPCILSEQPPCASVQKSSFSLKCKSQMEVPDDCIMSTVLKQIREYTGMPPCPFQGSKTYVSVKKSVAACICKQSRTCPPNKDKYKNRRRSDSKHKKLESRSRFPSCSSCRKRKLEKPCSTCSSVYDKETETVSSFSIDKEATYDYTCSCSKENIDSTCCFEMHKGRNNPSTSEYDLECDKTQTISCFCEYGPNSTCSCGYGLPCCNDKTGRNKRTTHKKKLPYCPTCCKPLQLCNCPKGNNPSLVACNIKSSPTLTNQSKILEASEKPCKRPSSPELSTCGVDEDNLKFATPPPLPPCSRSRPCSPPPPCSLPCEEPPPCFIPPSCSFTPPCPFPSSCVLPPPCSLPCAEPPPCEVISSFPMEISDIRRISSDSLLVKWSRPESMYVKGYEIMVGGLLKCRVRKPDRTSAILHKIKICKRVDIVIFALTATNRCQPPALGIYQL